MRAKIIPPAAVFREESLTRCIETVEYAGDDDLPAVCVAGEHQVKAVMQIGFYAVWHVDREDGVDRVGALCARGVVPPEALQAIRDCSRSCISPNSPDLYS